MALDRVENSAENTLVGQEVVTEVPFYTLPLELTFSVFIYLSDSDLLNVCLCSSTMLGNASGFASLRRTHAQKLLEEIKEKEGKYAFYYFGSPLVNFFEQQIKPATELQKFGMINSSGIKNYKQLCNVIKCIQLIHHAIHTDMIDEFSMKYFYNKLNYVVKFYDIKAVILTDPELLQKYIKFLADGPIQLTLVGVVDILGHEKCAMRKDMASLFESMVASAASHNVFSNMTIICKILKDVFPDQDNEKESIEMNENTDAPEAQHVSKKRKC